MKTADMHKKSKADLMKHAATLKEKVAATRQELYTKGNTNHREIRKIRKEIARALTIAHGKEDEAKKSAKKTAASDEAKKEETK